MLLGALTSKPALSSHSLNYPHLTHQPYLPPTPRRLPPARPCPSVVHDPNSFRLPSSLPSPLLQNSWNALGRWDQSSLFIYHGNNGDTRQDEGNRHTGCVHNLRKPTVNLT